MVMRIATFEQRPQVDADRNEAFRTWMASQPGLQTLYHDPVSGRYLSISVWESREAVLAMRDRAFPGGPLGIKPDTVILYDVDSAHSPPR